MENTAVFSVRHTKYSESKRSSEKCYSELAQCGISLVVSHMINGIIIPMWTVTLSSSTSPKFYC